MNYFLKGLTDLENKGMNIKKETWSGGIYYKVRVNIYKLIYVKYIIKKERPAEQHREHYRLHSDTP